MNRIDNMSTVFANYDTTVFSKLKDAAMGMASISIPEINIPDTEVIDLSPCRAAMPGMHSVNSAEICRPFMPHMEGRFLYPGRYAGAVFSASASGICTWTVPAGRGKIRLRNLLRPEPFTSGSVLPLSGMRSPTRICLPRWGQSNKFTHRSHSSFLHP